MLVWEALPRSGVRRHCGRRCRWDLGSMTMRVRNRRAFSIRQTRTTWTTVSPLALSRCAAFTW